ncbi:MAG TPA: hypothetical protein VL093_04400 [Flavipsychrobacter sp.]|nr:hypothetical protein [Flavipsychrobacter sp.]
MNVPVIYTIDAREHGFLEGMSAHYKWTTPEIYRQINLSAARTIEALKQKGINYTDLKNALIPHSNRKEIAFVFDSTLIDSSWYGYEVAKNFTPLLDKKSINSILLGDYIGEYKHARMYKELFYEFITAHKSITYKTHELFYLIYINNLSEDHFNTLNKGLQRMNAYVGYFNLTYSSPIKTVLSSILVRAILKYKTTIINPTEANVDENLTCFPFENNGYQVVGIDDLSYGLFLSYKIEREVFPGYETDHQFSINALSGDVRDLSTLPLIINENKIEYLRREKAGSMEMAGLNSLTTNQLSTIIKRKLKDNYLFNLSFIPDYETMKFNILIEVPRIDLEKPIKLLVALEYSPSSESLRLITMY